MAHAMAFVQGSWTTKATFSHRTKFIFSQACKVDVWHHKVCGQCPLRVLQIRADNLDDRVENLVLFLFCFRWEVLAFNSMLPVYVLVLKYRSKKKE